MKNLFLQKKACKANIFIVLKHHNDLLINCKNRLFAAFKYPYSPLDYMKRLFVCYITLGTLFFSTAFQPAEDYFEQDIKRHRIDEKKWEKLTKDLDYTVKEKPEEKAKGKARSTPAMKDQEAFADNFFQASKWIFILLALGVLIWLLISVLKASGLFAPGFKKVAALETITLENIEERLHETDLEAFLREALKNKQYNLAIRLYYLAVLKALSARELIRWKKDKTNKAYLSEMLDHPLYDHFREATLIFENAWYGDTAVSESTFLAAESKLKGLESSITN